MPTENIQIIIGALDRVDIANAILVVAERYENRAMKMPKDIKRDNVMARAIRLKRMAAELKATG